MTNIDERLARLYKRRGESMQEATEWWDEFQARQRIAEQKEEAAAVGRISYVLERMAATLWPSFRLPFKPYVANICHGFVSLAARKRMDPKDKIWLFGVKNPEHVWHSVLTDQNNNVIMDTFKRKGGFLERNGYILGGDDMDDADGADHLDCMLVISLGDLVERYKPSVYDLGPDAPVIQLASSPQTELSSQGFRVKTLNTGPEDKQFLMKLARVVLHNLRESGVQVLKSIVKSPRVAEIAIQTVSIEEWSDLMKKLVYKPIYEMKSSARKGRWAYSPVTSILGKDSGYLEEVTYEPKTGLVTVAVGRKFKNL